MGQILHPFGWDFFQIPATLREKEELCFYICLDEGINMWSHASQITVGV